MNPTCKDCGKEMSCGECRFWAPAEDDSSKVGKSKDGECRESSPQVLLVPAPAQVMAGVAREPRVMLNGFWPRTRPELWCGKFMRLTVVEKSTVVSIGMGATGSYGNSSPSTVVPAPDET